VVHLQYNDPDPNCGLANEFVGLTLSRWLEGFGRALPSSSLLEGSPNKKRHWQHFGLHRHFGDCAAAGQEHCALLPLVSSARTLDLCMDDCRKRRPLQMWVLSCFLCGSANAQQIATRFEKHGCLGGSSYCFVLTVCLHILASLANVFGLSHLRLHFHGPQLYFGRSGS
jgi:hypothetical protein